MKRQRRKTAPSFRHASVEDSSVAISCPMLARNSSTLPPTKTREFHQIRRNCCIFARMSILYVVRGDTQLNAWLNVAANGESLLREIALPFPPTKTRELQSFPPSKSTQSLYICSLSMVISSANARPNVDSKRRTLVVRNSSSPRFKKLQKSSSIPSYR